MSHTELDDEIELRQKLEAELEQLRADMALLEAENATYKQYGSCQDCGFPLDKTDDDDIVCHKCGEEIGDRIIKTQTERIAELEAKNEELVTALRVASICNNNGDHWNPYSPFAFKIAELTGVPVPGSDAASSAVESQKEE